jgi:hypothetical protein
MKSMMRNTAAALTLVLAAAALPGSASAHHGINKLYDQGKTVTITGKIDKVAWINPHIFFTVLVNEGGTEKTYKVESVPIAFARKAGITKQALLGDGRPVQVTITPSRTDPLLGFSALLRYADGRTISFAGFKE